jgi:sugar phosphate isomerase/epimerase
LDWAKTNGFDGVEITDNFFNFLVVDRAGLHRLKEECETRELEITAIEPLFIGLFRDQRAIREGMAKVERSIDVAALLGVKLVIISPYQEVEDEESFVPLDSDFEQAASNLKPLIRKARENGVKLIIEGPCGQLLRTADHILRLLQLVDDPDFGINIDFSSALPYLKQGESVEGFVRKLRNHVVYFGVWVKKAPMLCVGDEFTRQSINL